MQSRNNLKDAANKAMKSMSKQVTPILHLHSGIVEVSLKWGGGMKGLCSFPREENKICSYRCLHFSSQLTYGWCVSVFIPVNESAKGFVGLQLSLMIQRAHHSRPFP